MMVDSGTTAKGSMIDGLPEKDDDGGYASGGWKSKDGRLSCGYSSFRGKRASMEDFYDIKASKIGEQSVCLFGIFDGETYQQTDREFLESERDTFRDDGSTASTAVLVGNHLYVANVGDSRTIISKAGKGTWRVGGVLAMSRAFGNRMLKQFVVAEPEIQDLEVDQELELLVLASDGLWDVVPNEDAVSIAQTEEEPEGAARKLTEIAFTRGSADNITCIVVKFHHENKPADPEETQQHLEVDPQPMETQQDLEVSPQPMETQQHLEVNPQSNETQERKETPQNSKPNPEPEESHETSKAEPEETLTS
ncbi:hypothetical protein DH2020_044443 [Rehmannia glutinosa]|uniref:PPM-type phosphatase domain-containing protein n=1 Tax=Rehmannia glutinosa TaxID=99300 RepID=A0ABR0UIQ2_REHGL